MQLEFDVEGVDRYQRTLAYVLVGERRFNELLVRQALAQVSTYPPNVKYVDRLVAAQRQAGREGRVLWGRCGVGEGLAQEARRAGASDPTFATRISPVLLRPRLRCLAPPPGPLGGWSHSVSQPLPEDDRR